jgi:hypothetical protein
MLVLEDSAWIGLDESLPARRFVRLEPDERAIALDELTRDLRPQIGCLV